MNITKIIYFFNHRCPMCKIKTRTSDMYCWTCLQKIKIIKEAENKGKRLANEVIKQINKQKRN